MATNDDLYADANIRAPRPAGRQGEEERSRIEEPIAYDERRDRTTDLLLRAWRRSMQVERGGSEGDETHHHDERYQDLP